MTICEESIMGNEGKTIDGNVKQGLDDLGGNISSLLARFEEAKSRLTAVLALDVTEEDTGELAAVPSEGRSPVADRLVAMIYKVRAHNDELYMLMLHLELTDQEGEDPITKRPKATAICLKDIRSISGLREKLRTEMDQAASLVGRLVSSLEPILIDERPKEQTEGKDTSSVDASPFARDIEDLCSLSMQCIDYYDDIFRRLDL